MKTNWISSFSGATESFSLMSAFNSRGVPVIQSNKYCAVPLDEYKDDEIHIPNYYYGLSHPRFDRSATLIKEIASPCYKNHCYWRLQLS